MDEQFVRQADVGFVAGLVVSVCDYKKFAVGVIVKEGNEKIVRRGAAVAHVVLIRAGAGAGVGYAQQ